MSQKARIAVVIAVLAMIALVLALVSLPGRQTTATEEPQEGRIHLYVDGAFRANVDPAVIADVEQGSFADREEGKEQAGPWADALILAYVDARTLRPASTVTISGIRSSTGDAKSATLTWGQISDRNNHVLFDIAGSGDSVKLVSTLDSLDTRDEWVQGVARIEIVTKP